MDNVWTAYRLKFKLLTPLHIGWRKVGNLQQTRPYVLPRTLWGALTARLAREAGAASDDTLYKKVGEKVEKDLRFSCFYLSDQIEAELNCVGNPEGWPWQGRESSNSTLFDWKFLNSYEGSPITEQKVTEEGGLHETEYIMPLTREGKMVYLAGLIFERKKHDPYIKNWENALTGIQLGGERSYGWGRVGLVENVALTNNLLFGAHLELDDVDPRVIIPSNGFITSHVLLGSGAAGLKGFEGRVEMLAGRLTTQGKKHGRNFLTPLPCWVPGTRVVESKGFTICRDCIWRET